MSDAATPCKANPDQWFTERDGRRYDDEPLLTEAAILEMAGPLREREASFEDIEGALDDATAEVVRVRLIERRQAREACFSCPVRLPCLSKALESREQYGIWGGYFPEQRRAIEREIDRRAEEAAEKAKAEAEAAEAAPAEG